LWNNVHILTTPYIHVVAKQYLDAARLALLSLFACFKLHAASKAACPQAIIARCMEHIAQLAFATDMPPEDWLAAASWVVPSSHGASNASSDDQCALCDLQSIRRSTRSNTAYDGERQSLLGRLHGTMPQGVHRTAEALPSFGQVQHQAPVVISTQVASHDIALSCVMRQRPQIGQWKLWMHF
jgi:hypothetical protein